VSNFDWTCPFCGRDATLTDQSTVTQTIYLTHDNADGGCAITPLFVVCPNPKCKKFSLTATLHEAVYVTGMSLGYGEWEKTENELQTWNLIPASKAKALPDYIPAPIRDDYNEACLVLALSPKAAATLARRCLQGMIRDFWGVSLATLKAEIDAIQGKVDSLTWDAIESVRKVGNIVAHMEKDINVIVEVEPNEAVLLVGLVETLIKDWYVARESKKRHLESLVALAAQKDAAKKKTAATKP
jgi:Domain of unknown function (DUF4145)